MARKRQAARLQATRPRAASSAPASAGPSASSPAAPPQSAPPQSGPSPSGPSPSEAHRQDVAVYVAAGGDESVQRVITAVHGLSRRLNQWYDRQLADLDISAGEWAVMSTLVRDTTGKGCTPSQLADAAHVAPSSMTHRLDRMTTRGLVTRGTDPENRVRVRVALAEPGWDLFRNAIRESDMLESDVLASLTPEQRDQLAGLLEVAITGLDGLDS